MPKAGLFLLPVAGNKGRSAPITGPGSGQTLTCEGSIWQGNNNS